MGYGQRISAAAAVVVTAAALASCGPPPGPAGPTPTTVANPVPPSVTSFAVRGGVGPAPATVALGWTVTDPNGDLVTCELDADGDGNVDHVVFPCTSGVFVTSIPAAGPVTATLTVSDSTPGHTVVTDHTFVVGTDPVEPFDLELRGVASLEPEVADAFTAAAQRWEQVIVRGTAPFTLPPGQTCLDPSGTVPSVIDDVVIDVAVELIDGPGNVLGSAGPTCMASGSDLAVTGEMRFDSADVASLLADDAFDDVVLHEMGHVLGIGTLWNTVPYGGTRNLTAGVGTSSTRYTGPRAVAEFAGLTGVSNTSSVPVEATGGPGTQDAHWRESIFGDELMTGWIDVGNTPLSRMTVASLADLGLQVDLDAADAYLLPSARPAARAAAEPAEDVEPSDGRFVRPPLRRV